MENCRMISRPLLVLG